MDNSYRIVDRGTHCSAYCTAMSRDVNFDIKDDIYDTELWEKNPDGVMVVINPAPVGIKHGIGMTGGHNHSTCDEKDTNREKLRELVDKEAFDFYERLTANIAQL